MPANFPNSPTLNQTYSYNGSTWSWTGSYWRLETSQAMTGIAFTYGNAAPSSPNVGDRWIDTTTMLELVYVYDGNSYQWIELSSQAPSTNLAAVSTSITPTANVAYDLGSNTNRWRDLYLSGNSLIIGGATITATGSAIALPSGTTVGGQSVASGGDVATGGGPKITNLQITDNSWTVLDDTAVDTAGGYVLITGTNFVSGAQVYLNQTAANSVAFVSATTLRVTVPALTAGTYIVYVINPDGGTAIRVPGLTASANPAWQTASALPEQYDGVAISLSLVATDATSYTITSGSLPPGLSLNTGTGAITGTVTGVTVDTVYTFTVRATDAQLQDSPRTFTVTITVSDPYFNLTTLLLGGEQGNTVVRDSSVNNFNLTVAGDARASNFTPYGTGWSVYFDGTSDYLKTESSPNLTLGTGDFTIEFWVNPSDTSTAFRAIVGDNLYNSAGGWTLYQYGTAVRIYVPSLLILEATSALTASTWTHVAWTRFGSTNSLFINGAQAGTVSNSQNHAGTEIWIGDNNYTGTDYFFNGYISNLRIVKGTVVYTANFTPATTNLTAVANTSLLTCHVNSFRDASTNNFVITRNGDARVVSFNPFNITNTGVAGSMYFDGTGDYLSTSNSAFAVGTGAFTIEAWVYPFTVSGKALVSSLASSVDPAGDRGIACYLDGARIGRSVTAQLNDISTSIVPVAYQWNHIALVRENTSTNGVKFYVNGLLGGQGTSAISVNKQQVVVGRQYPSEDVNYLSGYISSVRWTNAAVYTSAFTPPTQPLTAVANTQLLTLQYRQPHNNHSFQDSSSNNFLITRNGNATQGTFSPFSPGGWSYYFNGSSWLRSTGSGVFTIGTAAYTFEAWIYQLARTRDEFIIGGVGSAFQVGITSAGYLQASLAGSITYTASTTVLPLNTWTHVALIRSSTAAGGLAYYVNGQPAGTAQDATNYIFTIDLNVGSTNGSSTYGFNGYISNMRYVQGQALSSGAFTVPNVALTANSVGWSGANVVASITGFNLRLLTCQNNRFVDNANFPHTFTANGTPSVQAWSPFAPTAVYSPVTHGGSGYLDGSGDYFILTNESAYDFADGNFSIDFWYYPLSAQGYGAIYTRDGQDYPLCIYSGTSITPAWPECVMAVGTTTTWFATDIKTLGVQKYAWNHIAFTRVGNTFRAFTNGVLSSVVTASGTMGSGGTPWLGKNGTAAGLSELSMYLSGFRMVKGGIPSLFSTTSTTTSTVIFTVPTQPFTANESLTSGSLSILANFTNAAILDSTGRNVIETVADAKSSSVITKFAGGSMSFDGTGDYLLSSAPLSELAFLHNGITPWTVEGWFYTGSTSAQYILSTDAASASIGLTIGLSDTNTRDIMAQIFRGVSGSWLLAISPTNSWNLNTWTHFAVTFDSSKNLTVYVNGVQVATASGSSFSFSSSNPSYPLVVGRYQSPTPGGYFNGYIDDLRVTRGYARYTGNFTAPTIPARLK